MNYQFGDLYRHNLSKITSNMKSTKILFNLFISFCLLFLCNQVRITFYLSRVCIERNTLYYIPVNLQLGTKCINNYLYSRVMEALVFQAAPSIDRFRNIYETVSVQIEFSKMHRLCFSKKISLACTYSARYTKLS